MVSHRSDIGCLLCRLLCPALFSLPWAWGVFPRLQQEQRTLHTSQRGATAATHSPAESSTILQAQQAQFGLRQGGVLGMLAAGSSGGMQSCWHPAGMGQRLLSSSTQDSHTEAATAATEVLPISISTPGSNGSNRPGRLDASHIDMSDTLTLAACIRRFRCRGHLVSQLDPLKRTPGGPWLGPIGDAYSR